MTFLTLLFSGPFWASLGTAILGIVQGIVNLFTGGTGV